MGEVARLVGVEIREYMKDNTKKRFCGLHLVYLEGASGDVIGSKVENVSCPRDVDPNKLEVGKLYELIYELYDIKGQKMARLKNLVPVEE